MKLLKRLSKKLELRRVLIYMLVYLILLFQTVPRSALATPNGSSVVAGSANVTQVANTTSVTMNTSKAVINWNGLNTNSAETLAFTKASGGFAVLNRVTGAGATTFNGTLNGNQGHIIIVNPHGITFGSTAVINAFKFTASGLGITQSDYTAWYNGSGQLRFTYGCGTVTNNSTTPTGISAQQISLIGQSVTNNGIIRTTNPDGLVIMAAGDKVYLAESGSSVIVDYIGNVGDKVARNTGTIDAPGGTIYLAAGDIFSQAIITGAGSFIAQAARDITISEPISAGTFDARANQNLNINGALNITGDAKLYADADQTLPGDFHSTASITAGGNIDITGNDVLIEEQVDAGGNLTIKGRDCYENPEWSWGNVTAMKTLTAGGDIKISDTGEQKEWIDGHWEGRTWIDGYWKEGQCGHMEWVCGHWEGGWYVPGYWDISYAPGTIYLHDNVTAGGNLMLCNNTETFDDTGFGVRLQAGRSVILAEDGISNSQRDNCTFLHGRHNLEIVALNGRITNDSSLFGNPDATPSMLGAPLTTISVEGSTLLMQQTPSINLDDFLFALQNTTDLTLISNNGSVTAVETGTKPENAADQWKSIGATADNGSDNGGNAILLTGNQKDITTTELRAYHDDITVNAKAGKILATENVTADTGSIGFVANTNIEADKDLTAGTDITAAANNNILLKGNATAGRNLTLAAGADIETQGNLTATGGSIVASAVGNNLLKGNATAGQNITLLSGSNTEAQGNLTAGGNITASAGNNILLKGNTTAGQNINLTAVADVEAQGNLTAGQDVTISSSDTTTYLGGNVNAGNNVLLNNNTKLNGAGDQSITAQNGTVLAKGTLDKTTNGHMSVLAADGITLSGAASAVDSMYLDADTDEDGIGDMLAQSTLTTTNGDIEISASDSTIKLQDNVSAGEDLILNNNTEVAADKKLQAGDDVKAYGNLNGKGNLTIEAGDDVKLHGDTTVAGNLDIYASENTIYLWGDTYAAGNILFNTNTKFEGWDDQIVDAGGTLTVNGWLNKLNFSWCGGWSDGSLYLHANSDIMLAGDVTAAICCPEVCWSAGGGVAIVSTNGAIYTPGFELDGKPALAINITGRSDQLEGIGVGLPIGPVTIGRLAILIRSQEDLVLAESSSLTACGRYYDIDSFRSGLGFLDIFENIPVGGALRNPGDAFDAAIYVGSKAGNVHVGGQVDIRSREPVNGVVDDVVEQKLERISTEPAYACVNRGAMIVDARDTVTFGENFESSLADGRIGDRLEVCSRITEWLDDAIGRLPFPVDLVLPAGYNYVMRGAGAENPDIGDGAPAWVLEARPGIGAAPIQQYKLEFTGCPAVMSWVANELGVPADQISVYMNGTTAMGSGIQPCDTCAKLQNAALALKDADGTQIAALGQVVNEFAGAGTPPSEEQMAMIASALNNPKEGTQYALAAQWINALTEYTTIMHNDLNVPTNEAVALATKYTAPVTNGDNAAVAAFVQAKLAALGG